MANTGEGAANEQSDRAKSDEARAGQRPTKSGWVSWSPQGGTGLSDEFRTEVERSVQANQKKRGGLLAIVEVRVFENEAEAQVSFPRDGLLGPDSDTDAVSAVVARAGAELASWR